MGKNTVTRWLPNNAYDIGRNENWLRDMSAKGLHLRKFARRGVIFDRGAPRDLVYRIEVVSAAPTEEQLALYQDCGWRFVTTCGEMLCVFVAEGGTPVQELHNDTVVQSFAYGKLGKVLRGNLILIAVLVVLLIALILGMVVFQEEPMLMLITGPAVQNALLILVELFVLLSQFENYRSIARLRQSLLNGVPIDHNRPYRAHAAVSGFISGMVLLLAGVTVVVPLYEISRDRDIALSDDLPLVRLAEIEQNPALIPEVNLDSGGVDHANVVNTDWSLLAPDQYSTRERLTDGADYNPSLMNDYYRLRIPALAEPLLNDLIQRYAIRFERGTAVRVEFPGLDTVYLVSNEDYHEIFARRDGQVLHIIYRGRASADRLLELTAETLGEIPAG